MSTYRLHKYVPNNSSILNTVFELSADKWNFTRIS